MNYKCVHKRTQIWEPHLAGARRCQDCGELYNPNRGGWFRCDHKYSQNRDDVTTCSDCCATLTKDELPKPECQHKEVQIFDITFGSLAFRCVNCKEMVKPKNGWTKA